MTQSAQPVQPTPPQNSPVEAVADEPDDGLPILEEIGRDYERLSKRIATIIKNASNGEPVTVVDTLRLQGELVMLLLDHLTHTKRMEDHAVWASDQLENLADAVSGNSETSSQLHKTDADRYMSFLGEVLGFIDDRIETLTPPGGEAPAGLVSLREQAVALRTLTEDITLEEDGEEPDAEVPTETDPENEAATE